MPNLSTFRHSLPPSDHNTNPLPYNSSNSPGPRNPR